VVYTQMLNAKGGIECDLTVTRLAADAYYIVTGTGFATHDFAWIRRHLPERADARLLDVTSAFAVLPVMGPLARDLLARVTSDDVSNAAFPFATWRAIHVAGASVRALRVTYVGELGYELHVPVELALAVYEALLQAGQALGLAHAGYRAIESLRLEKGYRAWGADIGPDHTPLEAGLGFAVKLGTTEPFLGREALELQLTTGLTKRLACFTVDDPQIVLLGRETIYRNGAPVGWLGSGGYGYTVGRGIGYGYVRHTAEVDQDWLTSGRYELEVATIRVPATLHLEPLYDPTASRIRQ
jgi:4-methylaminobutanoate oxidase (formaldehyde-forming)